MDKNNFKKQNVYVSEEEKALNWEDVKILLKKLLALSLFKLVFQKISW